MFEPHDRSFMKYLSQFLITLFMPAILSAQTVDIKDIKDDAQDTTIEIRKGKSAEKVISAKAVWETQDGTADIEGEDAPSSKEAKANYKKACDDWKKEFRADNKDNKIISMNCGKQVCSNDIGKHTCKSEATYKIKTKID